jgi:SAM-dependent methyltransferase
MSEQRQQRVVFGEAVDQYEAARPGYPEDLVDDVLAFAGPGPVVEIGAGTGKASVLFARRGTDLTCVEPDPRMAEALRRNLAGFPDARVVVSGFEEWSRPADSARLLICAQAWHWIEPEIAWTKAREIIEPGGALALWWNKFAVPGRVYDVLAEAHDRHGQVELARHTLGGDTSGTGDASGTESTGDRQEEDANGWPNGDVCATTNFQDFESRGYSSEHRLDPERLVDLLLSISAYRMLDDAVREALIADVRTVAQELGGVTLDVTTALFLARPKG